MEFHWQRIPREVKTEALPGNARQSCRPSSPSYMESQRERIPDPRAIWNPAGCELCGIQGRDTRAIWNPWRSNCSAEVRPYGSFRPQAFQNFLQHVCSKLVGSQQLLQSTRSLHVHSRLLWPRSDFLRETPESGLGAYPNGPNRKTNDGSIGQRKVSM